MSVILAFLLTLAVVIGLWLSRQRLASKPWLETGLAMPEAEAPAVAPATLGLAVFLAVVGGLFALMGSAFVMQIDAAPWQLVPLPPVVWFSTGALVASSLCLQLAAASAREGNTPLFHAALGAGTAAVVAFLVGQGMAWTALTADGYTLSGTPAASFFYLITGLHGLHILGGLAVLGTLWLRAADGAGAAAVQAGIARCAAYWHALLFVWLVLFALFAGWANEVLAICRAVLN